MIIDRVKVGYLEENCYIISKDNKCLIIDPGDEFYKIKKKVQGKEVLAILITHYHFDHVGALEECLNYYKCKLVDYNNKVSSIGPFKFDMILTPGHKEDSVTYYFKDDKIMFVGDFIFKDGIGRCDLKGGSVNDMISSINNIKKYDKQIIIYPGHGDFTNLGDEINNNPYLKGMI